MSSIKGSIVLEPFACPDELSSYTKGSQKYLCFYLHNFTPNYGLAEDFKQFVLAVSDNVLDTTNSLKKLNRRSKGEFFSIPLASLKFKPDFRQGFLFSEN